MRLYYYISKPLTLQTLSPVLGEYAGSIFPSPSPFIPLEIWSPGIDDYRVVHWAQILLELDLYFCVMMRLLPCGSKLFADSSAIVTIGLTGDNGAWSCQTDEWIALSYCWWWVTCIWSSLRSLSAQLSRSHDEGSRSWIVNSGTTGSEILSSVGCEMGLAYIIACK